MIRSEVAALDASLRSIGSRVHGFAVHRKSGVAGPYLARLRYQGESAERDIIVQEGLWYALVRQVERLQLSTLSDDAEVYLTTADHPDDLVTRAGGPTDGRGDAFPAKVGDGGEFALTVEPPVTARGVVFALTQSGAGAITWKLYAPHGDGFSILLGSVSIGAGAGTWLVAVTANGYVSASGGATVSINAITGGGIPRRVILSAGTGVAVPATWTVRGLFTGYAN